MSAIDWSFWLGLEIVEEWKACALSIGIDPDSVRLDQYGNFYTSSHSLPSFDPFCFPTAVSKENFDRRLRLLAAHSKNTAHFRRPSAVTSSPGCREIYLSDFATWAVWVMKLDEFPPELAALATVLAAPLSDASTAEASQPIPVAINSSFKIRRNILDPAIEKATGMTGNKDTAAVFLALKNMALNGEAPFTGQVSNGNLCYTDDNNTVVYLTKNALRARLRRRQRAVALDSER
ncbi:hypothetical protein [Paraburkholderia domus]|uniref:hypothetical protein n=1 Tax=Paraburkholderia domus TaxID=2793075 RepID=UPI00191372CA|nr:hypothetical protein [Paraburkholderia domus]MBK5058815.1 hypothetical protein [Burkholderia sp. R-70199]CAE6878720.1 hypothetical protein R70199_02379 [Paraburkholderia domus]